MRLLCVLGDEAGILPCRQTRIQFRFECGKRSMNQGDRFLVPAHGVWKMSGVLSHGCTPSAPPSDFESAQHGITIEIPDANFQGDAIGFGVFAAFAIAVDEHVVSLKLRVTPDRSSTYVDSETRMAVIVAPWQCSRGAACTPPQAGRWRLLDSFLRITKRVSDREGTGCRA